MTRQNGGYLDRGRGRFDVSPLILTRVFRRRRAVSCGVTVIDGNYAPAAFWCDDTEADNA